MHLGKSKIWSRIHDHSDDLELSLFASSQSCGADFHFQSYKALKDERDQFHEVVLHGETPVFVNTAIAATVAEVESLSTFRETCLATEVQESFTKPTKLSWNFFAAPLHTSFNV